MATREVALQELRAIAMARFRNVAIRNPRFSILAQRACAIPLACKLLKRHLMIPAIAFLSQGKLHLNTGPAGTRVIPSVFGETVRERALRMHQKNAWKTQGSGAQFMSGGMLWGGSERDPAEMRIEVPDSPAANSRPI